MNLRLLIISAFILASITSSTSTTTKKPTTTTTKRPTTKRPTTTTTPRNPVNVKLSNMAKLSSKIGRYLINGTTIDVTEINKEVITFIYVLKIMDVLIFNFFHKKRFKNISPQNT